MPNNLKNVTRDGRPVEEFLAEQATIEIAEVRESENKFRIKLPARTKHSGNHSGTKTQAGYSVYLGDPLTTHVLAYGKFWPKEDKFPCEPGGLSAYGIAEFSADEHTDADYPDGRFKCCECGEWHKGFTQHVLGNHKQHPSMRDYKIKFGLSQRTRFASPAAKKIMRERLMDTVRVHGRPKKGNVFNSETWRAGERAKTEIRELRNDSRRSPELGNLRDLCRAQMLRDVKQFRDFLGRTPTGREMDRFTNAKGFHSLEHKAITDLFGSCSGFFACAEILVRKRGSVTDPEMRKRNASAATKRVWDQMSPEDRARVRAARKKAWDSRSDGSKARSLDGARRGREARWAAIPQ